MYYIYDPGIHQAKNMGSLITAVGTMDTAIVGSVDLVLLSVPYSRQPTSLVGCSSWRHFRSSCFLFNGKIFTLFFYYHSTHLMHFTIIFALFCILRCLTKIQALSLLDWLSGMVCRHGLHEYSWGVKSLSTFATLSLFLHKHILHFCLFPRFIFIVWYAESRW